MPTMDTGRGAEPGLFTADWAALEFVTWWKTDARPLGREGLPDARDLLVGDLPHGVERAADPGGQRADRAGGGRDLDTEVAAVASAGRRR